MGASQLATDTELQERMRLILTAGNIGSTGEGAESSTADGAADAADATATLARVVWSRLAEPGDAVAGELIAALGPDRALELIMARADHERIRDEARNSGAELSARSVREAAERWGPRLDRAATLADLDRAIATEMTLVTPESAWWPAQLDDLDRHAPLMLWVLGNPAALSAFSLAVVGARACTTYGSHITAELTDTVCSAGAAIVSGGAYGIDAVAHRAALASDSTTVAVVAGGADRVYPAAHAGLFERIARNGAVCSEMAPGTAPTRWRFLQRNRLIAALAQAVLVTEAGARSGSLNTAGHAAELARPLAAVPGPVTSAASTGCHRLIREYDATLVSNGAELLDFIGIGDAALAGIDPGTEGGADADGAPGGEAGAGRQPHIHRRVLDALPLRGGRAAPEIAQLSGLTRKEVRGVLAELELLGSVIRGDPTGGSEAEWKLVRRK